MPEKVKVHELSKICGVKSREIIKALQELGLPIHHHANAVDSDVADDIISMFSEREGKKERPNDKKTKAPKKTQTRKSTPPEEKEEETTEVRKQITEEQKRDALPTETKKTEKQPRTQESQKPQLDSKKSKSRKYRGKESIRRGDLRQTQKSQIVDGIVRISEPFMVREFAEAINKPHTIVQAELMKLNLMYNVNQVLPNDIAEQIAEKLGIVLEIVSVDEMDTIIEEEEEEQTDTLTPRPPVVTVMGHVDHGKTRLLDTIRKTNVIDTESGGITQHIGAYRVEINNKPIVFLDTPGHEAFTAMRARGAKVTDIVVLVVAADDSIQPQTIEAIDHAKDAGVPIIVAINKIDKENADINRVKGDMMRYNLVPEEYGGDIITVEISAKFNKNIDELLEMILLQAEILELTTVTDRLARGTVIEARLDKYKGSTSTVLIQSGTLHIGDHFIAGAHNGKVKALINDRGERLEVATPSTPVEVLGFNGVPKAGDNFVVVETAQKARLISEQRMEDERLKTMAADSKINLNQLFKQIQEGKVKELRLILKADVQGSIEAMRESILKLATEKVAIDVIHGSVGNIKETDVMLASASNAIIIGFHVGIEGSARGIANLEKVDIRLYEVIYDAIEDVKGAMEGLLDPIVEEQIIGKARVKQVFKISKVGIIAGLEVIEGKVTRTAIARIYRNGEFIFESKVNTLKHHKDDVKEIVAGMECGVSLENYSEYVQDDILEFITQKKVAAKL